MDVAIEFSPNPSEEEMWNWQRQNDTGFAELKRALGLPLSLHVERDDVVWPEIRKNAKTPRYVIEKVCCVVTPARGK